MKFQLFIFTFLNMMSEGNFSCRASGCMQSFKFRNQRIRHEKKFHETSELEVVVVGGRLSRLCGICSERVNDIFSLCSHVENAHGIQARIIKKEFESELEFNAWKSDIHQTSGAEFFTTKSEKLRAEKRFLCHRTGTYQPIGGTSVNSRAPRETPTIKMGFDCTAFIKLKQVEGKFVATACLDHYGHTMDPKLLHSDASTQAEVVQMLKEDRRPAWIVKQIRSKGKGREKLIRTMDIWNIRDKFGLKKYEKHRNDSTSIELWVRELLQAHGAQSLLFCYRPMVEDDPNSFCIAIQTEFQRDMLVALGNKAICVDDTHQMTEYEFKLATVMVIDENGNGFPAAWFISKLMNAESVIIIHNVRAKILVKLPVISEPVHIRSPKFG